MRTKEMAVQALLRAKSQIERSGHWLTNRGVHRLTEDEEDKLADMIIAIEDMIHQIEKK